MRFLKAAGAGESLKMVNYIQQRETQLWGNKDFTVQKLCFSIGLPSHLVVSAVWSILPNNSWVTEG